MRSKIRGFIILVLKGIGMGAANVIPGVSGGTIALVTGIFERLINAIKSFNVKAIKLLFQFKLKEFSKHVDLWFLIAVFIGIGLSVFTLAWLLDYLFVNYPVFIWAYFFGLILASVYFVGKSISKWDITVIFTFIIGTAVAVSISFLSPATENESMFYLFLCGIAGICSMILPGLSGSFVLILMGNYQLVLQSTKDLDFQLLAPVIAGAVFGLLAFSHILSWLFNKYKNQTIGLLTGFILGSLGVLWPWKKSYDMAGKLMETNKYGAFIDDVGNVIRDVKVSTYDQVMPETLNSVVICSFLLAIAGVLSIWLLEKVAEKKSE